MKSIQIIIILIALSSLTYGQTSINCLPDKGIKIAKTVAKLESESKAENMNNGNFREVHYDTEGRVILIKNGRDGTVNRREYKDGKLQLMTSTRKKLPDFYSDEDLDSLMINSEDVTDTAYITRYHANGEIAELKHADGASQMFEYNACQAESNTLLNSVGDTIQQYQSIFENGVVIKTIWTPFQPVKSDVITDYYDYKFNKYGHWTSRKYRSNRGVIIEKRNLTYY